METGDVLPDPIPATEKWIDMVGDMSLYLRVRFNEPGKKALTEIGLYRIKYTKAGHIVR